MLTESQPPGQKKYWLSLICSVKCGACPLHTLVKMGATRGVWLHPWKINQGLKQHMKVFTTMMLNLLGCRIFLV